MDIGGRPFVEEVSYDRPTIALLTENARRIGIGILIASAIFTIIAVLLINSSIRLSIYSKRFIIKTMQMVGATKSFIRRPFIWTNIKLGMLGALVSLLGLYGLLFYLNQNFPELGLLDDPIRLGVVFVSVFVLGVLIATASTYFATQRFLNLRTDDLYY
jgi:cell division transport system permease protein